MNNSDILIFSLVILFILILVIVFVLLLPRRSAGSRETRGETATGQPQPPPPSAKSDGSTQAPPPYKPRPVLSVTPDLQMRTEAVISRAGPAKSGNNNTGTEARAPQQLHSDSIIKLGSGDFTVTASAARKMTVDDVGGSPSDKTPYRIKFSDLSHQLVMVKEQPERTDIVVREKNDVLIYISEPAKKYLQDVVLDYKEGPGGGGFSLIHQRAAST